MVALGLVAVVSLSVVGLFSRLAVSSQVSAEQAAADLLASTLIERAASEGPPEWGVGEAQVFQENPASLETGNAQGSEAMVFQVIPEELERQPLGVLYRLRVRVSWQEDSGPQNAERGRGLVERSRLVYVEDSGDAETP